MGTGRSQESFGSVFGRPRAASGPLSERPAGPEAYPGWVRFGIGSRCLAGAEAYPDLKKLKSGYDLESVLGLLQAPKHTQILEFKIWI